MSFGTRLKEKREAIGITQPQLAEMLGVSKGAIGNWETDVNSPRATLLYDLFDILNCDANYLFQDKMKELSYKDKATPEEFEKLVKRYRDLDTYGQETVNMVLDRETVRANTIREQNDKVKKLETVLHQSETIMRIYTYMRRITCAGAGFYFDDIPTDTIKAPYMEGADFIIGVNGDSMEPDYHDGEDLYVKKTDHINYGEMGIFTINNECFLKEFGENGLISKNKRYKDIPWDEDVRLIGKVIGKVPDNITE